MNPESSLFLQIFEIQSARAGLYSSALRVTFIILVSLELDGKIDVSYWVVFIPFWVYFLPTVFSFVIDCMRAQYLFNTAPTSTTTVDEDTLKIEIEKRNEINPSPKP